MPYVDYSTKQVEPLLSEEEVLKEGGVHQARWRLQRKRYSVRVEFEQAGILGTCRGCGKHYMYSGTSKLLGCPLLRGNKCTITMRSRKRLSSSQRYSETCIKRPRLGQKKWSLNRGGENAW